MHHEDHEGQEEPNELITESLPNIFVVFVSFVVS